MAMSALTDDLGTVFDPRIFGESAVLTTSSGSTTINGIFDQEDVPVEDATFGQFVRETKFTCKSSDVASAVPDDTLKIGTTTYYITIIVDDGTGVSEVYLSTDTV